MRNFRRIEERFTIAEATVRTSLRPDALPSGMDLLRLVKLWVSLVCAPTRRTPSARHIVTNRVVILLIVLLMLRVVEQEIMAIARAGAGFVVNGATEIPSDKSAEADWPCR